MTKRKVYENGKQVVRNRAMVLEAVRAAGESGASKAELIAATGLCDSAIRKHLHHLRDLKLVERSGASGATVRWGPPGIAERYARVGYATENARRIGLMRRLAREAGAADLDRVVKVTQIIVDARQAPPLRPTGPVSVWALGRAA